MLYSTIFFLYMFVIKMENSNAAKNKVSRCKCGNTPGVERGGRLGMKRSLEWKVYPSFR